MDDLYSLLIGDPRNKEAIISEALRRRNQMGTLGVLTGDKTLSKTGQGLLDSNDDYIKQLQQTRQNAQRQNQTKTYEDAQLQYMNDNLAERKRATDLEHEYQMAMAKAAQDRADRPAGGGRIPKLRSQDIKTLQDAGNTVGAIDGIQKFLDNGGSFGAKEVMGVPVPGSRALANTAAAMGYGTPEDKASFLAKQNWEQFYNIANRNRMFGATLTEHEKKAWDDANPSVGMTDEQLRAALPIMKKVYAHRLDKMAGGLIKEGYNAEAVADYADVPGINLPLAVGGGAPVDQAGGGTTPTAGAKPKRWIQQADGSFKQE